MHGIEHVQAHGAFGTVLTLTHILNGRMYSKRIIQTMWHINSNLKIISKVKHWKSDITPMYVTYTWRQVLCLGEYVSRSAVQLAYNTRSYLPFEDRWLLKRLLWPNYPSIQMDMQSFRSTKIYMAPRLSYSIQVSG